MAARKCKADTWLVLRFNWTALLQREQRKYLESPPRRVRQGERALRSPRTDAPQMLPRPQHWPSKAPASAAPQVRQGRDPHQEARPGRTWRSCCCKRCWGEEVRLGHLSAKRLSLVSHPLLRRSASSGGPVAGLRCHRHPQMPPTRGAACRAHTAQPLAA